MDAVTDLLYEEGPVAMSTVRIAQRAGIVQSGFYRHFPSVEECLRAKADQLGADLAWPALNGISSLYETDPTNAALLANVLEEFFIGMLTHRRLYQLMVRHRHDASPLGEAFRRVFDQSRLELTASLWALARRFRLPVTARSGVALLAEFAIESTSSVGTALLTGRARDPRAAAETLARCLVSAVTAEFQHMYAEGPRAEPPAEPQHAGERSVRGRAHGAAEEPQPARGRGARAPRSKGH
jgi:AcrR family transcriptional regulator